MSELEYQNLLAPALTMNEREAAGHYYNLAENWYHLQNNRAFKSFSRHIPSIIKLLASNDKNTRLDAVRALAFVAACPRLHIELFENHVLNSIVHILGSAPEAANCEAALVVLNHLCTQSPKNHKRRYNLVTKFCEDKKSLIIILRYAHVEDKCLSIIANVFSVLAALCTHRPKIQEHCILAGIMERAYNLKTSHRDRIVRTNVDLFLVSLGLDQYSADKFSEMHATISMSMGYSSRALCLGIWRLVTCDRLQHARNMNYVITVVDQISQEYTTLDEDWKIVATFVDGQKSSNHKPNNDNHHNNHNDNDNDYMSASKSLPENIQKELYDELHLPNTNIKNNSVSDSMNGLQQKPPNYPAKNDRKSVPTELDHHPQPSYNDNNAMPIMPNKNMKASVSVPPNHMNKGVSVPPDDFEDEKKDSSYELRRISSVPASSRMFQQIDYQNHKSKYVPKPRNGDWLQKQIDIAILQTNPIDSEECGNLALEQELRKLKDVFFRCRRGLKIFFGVLTKDSLIRCIQRGAQVVHISGHGPYEKKLKVEDKFGRMQDLSADKIREAIQKGSGAQLKLVFVSTCYSEQVAQSFCAAGVPHVVAVHSKVQILDEMATKFASAFYSHLISHRKTVLTAFTNARAELLLEREMDCCCRHEGHTSSCLCPFCCSPRCCTHHHNSPKCISECGSANVSQKFECCAPDVPHKHADKFLLLPGVHEQHDTALFENLVNLDGHECECIDSRALSNVGQYRLTKIVGRARDTRILVDFLHPDNENQGDVVFIFGKPKIGISSVAAQVSYFFNRPWYQAIFLGGVWRVNLRNCHDPTHLFSSIAAAMKIDTVLGSYSRYSHLKHKYIPYPSDIESQLLQFDDDDSNANDDAVTYFDDANNAHYIIFNASAINNDTLPEDIFKCATQRIHTLPMEFVIDLESGKVVCNKIKFIPPDEECILQDIKQYGNGSINANVQFQKLFIIDHIDFIENSKLKKFLTKINRLTRVITCKCLLACHEKVEEKIQKIQKDYNSQCGLKGRSRRINPIGARDSAKLLLEQARQLYEFDFRGCETPNTAEETAKFEIFEWLARSPSLIQQCSTVLDRKVPFCVIIKCMESEPKEWSRALDDWKVPLKLQDDELKDAIKSLTILLTELNVVKSIWND